METRLPDNPVPQKLFKSCTITRSDGSLMDVLVPIPLPGNRVLENYSDKNGTKAIVAKSVPLCKVVYPPNNTYQNTASNLCMLPNNYSCVSNVMPVTASSLPSSTIGSTQFVNSKTYLHKNSSTTLASSPNFLVPSRAVSLIPSKVPVSSISSTMPLVSVADTRNQSQSGVNTTSQNKVLTYVYPASSSSSMSNGKSMVQKKFIVLDGNDKPMKKVLVNNQSSSHYQMTAITNTNLLPKEKRDFNLKSILQNGNLVQTTSQHGNATDKSTKTVVFPKSQVMPSVEMPSFEKYLIGEISPKNPSVISFPPLPAGYVYAFKNPPTAKISSAATTSNFSKAKQPNAQPLNSNIQNMKLIKLPINASTMANVKNIKLEDGKQNLYPLLTMQNRSIMTVAGAVQNQAIKPVKTNVIPKTCKIEETALKPQSQFKSYSATKVLSPNEIQIKQEMIDIDVKDILKTAFQLKETDTVQMKTIQDNKLDCNFKVGPVVKNNMCSILSGKNSEIPLKCVTIPKTDILGKNMNIISAESLKQFSLKSDANAGKNKIFLNAPLMDDASELSQHLGVQSNFDTQKPTIVIRSSNFNQQFLKFIKQPPQQVQRTGVAQPVKSCNLLNAGMMAAATINKDCSRSDLIGQGVEKEYEQMDFIDNDEETPYNMLEPVVEIIEEEEKSVNIPSWSPVKRQKTIPRKRGKQRVPNRYWQRKKLTLGNRQNRNKNSAPVLKDCHVLLARLNTKALNNQRVDLSKVSEEELFHWGGEFAKNYKIKNVGYNQKDIARLSPRKREFKKDLKDGLVSSKMEQTLHGFDNVKGKLNGKQTCDKVNSPPKLKMHNHNKIVFLKQKLQQALNVTNELKFKS